MGRWLALGLSLVLAGCSGEIGQRSGNPGAPEAPWLGGDGNATGDGPRADGAGPSPGSDPASGGAGSDGAGNNDGAGDPATAAEAPRPTLRRLTPRQYENSMRDLLNVEVDASGMPEIPPLNGLTAIGAGVVALSELDLETFEALADATAAELFADAGARLAVVGCEAAEAGCVSEFVTRFGRRAFRRPLTDAEVTRFSALAERAAELTQDPWMGPRFALSALLQSPHFLYRVELGEPDPSDPTRRVLNDYELATRLSFLLWNTTPDDALLDAARAGLLTTADGLRDEAERLLGAPRARDALLDFYAGYLHLDRLQTLDKLPEAYPQMSDTLGEAMRAETLQMLARLTFDEAADFRTAFTTRSTFIDAELADLYGVSAPAGGELASFAFPDDSPRAGLLTQASFLALHAHQTSSSPTLRGKFVRESLLCEGIPPPPPDVDTTLPDASEAPTARERLSVHRQNDACAGCHAMMDPIGLALERFDGIGAYRTTENGATIDPSGDLDGTSFADAVGLGRALSEHPGLTACLTRTLLRQARGTLEDRSEDARIAALDRAFADAGYRVPDLLLQLVQSAAFRELGELDQAPTDPQASEGSSP